MCFGRERRVFDLFWVFFFFDKKCVTVTSDWEMDYRIVTEGSTSG